MANKFTYEVHVDLSSLRGQSMQARQMLESVFSGVGKNASPLGNIAKDVDKIRASMERLNSVDLGKSFSGFSQQLQRAQEDAKALDGILRGLSGKGIHLPDISAQASKIKRDLEGIGKIDIAEQIRAQLNSIATLPPVSLRVGLDTASINQSAAAVQAAVRTAFGGLDKSMLPTGTMIPELQQIKTQLDLIGKSDFSRVFIDVNNQINQILNAAAGIQTTLRNAFTLNSNALVSSVSPQIDILKQQLQSINQVDVSGSINEIKQQLLDLKTVVSSISLAGRFKTPPKFMDRIEAMRRNVMSLNDIVINIPNPFANLKDWTVQTRQEVTGLKNDLESIQPVKKGRGKTATEEAPGLSALKAELQSVGQIDITKPLVDFRSQISLAAAELDKLRSDGGVINAQSTTKQSSAVGKPFTGFSDIQGATMQIRQQAMAIGNMNISKPFDDLERQALEASANVTRLSNDIGKLQQPRGSMNLSDLAGGGGGGETPKPKRGSAKKIAETAVPEETKALEKEVQELKSKLAEISGIIAQLNSVNVTQDTAAVSSNINQARTHLAEVGKQLTELGRFKIEADLTPLLDQVKRIGLSISKVMRFSELAKIDPAGDISSVQAKVAAMRQNIVSVDQTLGALTSVHLTTDIAPLMAELKKMRLNLSYIGRFAENLSGIGVFADLTPLQAKIEELRQNLAKISTIVSALSGAAPSKDLSATVGKIQKAKDDLGAIGRAVAELSQVVLEAGSAASIKKVATGFESIRTPLETLSKTVEELSKVKFNKDISPLAAQVGIAAAPLAALSRSIGSLNGLTVTGDITGFSASIEQTKNALLAIKASAGELSKFKIEGNIGQIGSDTQALKTQLDVLSQTVTALSSIPFPAGKSLDGIGAKISAFGPPLGLISSAVKDLDGRNLKSPPAGFGDKLAKLSESVAAIGAAIGAIRGVSVPSGADTLTNTVSKIIAIKEPIKSLSALIGELSSVKFDKDLTGLGAQVAKAVQPLTVLSQAISAISAVTFTGDISTLQSKITQIKNSLTAIGTAITDLSTFSFAGDIGPLRDQLQKMKAPLSEVGQLISQIATINIPADPAAINALAGALKGIKKPLSDLNAAIAPLIGITIESKLAVLIRQLGAAKLQLTSLTAALVEFVATPHPPDPAAIAAVVDGFNRKPFDNIAKVIAGLSEVVIAGDIKHLADQLAQIKSPLAEITASLAQISALAPTNGGSVIDSLAKQFKTTSGARGVGDLAGKVEGLRDQSKAAAAAASKLSSADVTAEQLEATLKSIPAIDITKPIDDLRNDVVLAEKDVRSLDAAIQDMLIKGGGGSGGTARSNALHNDFIDKLSRSQGDEAAAIAKATGKVPSMGAMSSEFATDKIPVEEFEVNAKRNQVLDKRRFTAQEELNSLQLQEQLIAKQILITQTERAIYAREQAAVQQEFNALAGTPDNINKRQQLARELSIYQEESARLTAQESLQLAELTRAKNQIALQTKKAMGKESGTTEDKNARSVTVTDKSADNAAQLVESLGKAAVAMESIATWSAKELENQRASIGIEREKLQMRRQETAATEKLVQLERTDGERQRLEMQQSAAIISVEQNRTALIQARLEFERLITAEVARQVDLHKSLKTPNTKGAAAVQSVASATGTPTADPNTQAAASATAQTAAIVAALQQQATMVSQQAAASGTAQSAALLAAYQQTAAAVQASPVVTAINALTTNMATAIQNQSATVKQQYQGVSQTLQQILDKKAEIEKVMGGNLIMSRLEKGVEFDGLKTFSGEKLQQQVDSIKGQFAELSNLSKGAKETMRSDLAQRTTDLSTAYQRELSTITKYSSDLSSAYKQDAGELRKQVDARKELFKQSADPNSKATVSAEISALEDQLKALNDVFNRQTDRVRRHREAIAAEYGQLNSELSRQSKALSLPGQGDPNAGKSANDSQAKIYQEQQVQMDQIRKKELDSLRQSTVAEKGELDKKVQNSRRAIQQESSLSRQSLDEKRQSLQTEINILTQSNQQRRDSLQQQVDQLRRAAQQQVAPLRKNVAELKVAMESQIGVERETTEKTIAEIQRRIVATEQLYREQVRRIRQSISGLREAYQQQIAPLQEQMNTLQSAQPKNTMFQNLLNVGKGFASIYATIMGSRQIVQAIVSLDQYTTQLRRAKVATIELSGGAAQAESAITAIKSASGGTITSLTAMKIANQAMALDLANNSAEFERLTIAARGVALVSPVIHDVQSAITELALASANMSYRRLDQLGLSVTEVKDRMEELQSANGNLSDNQAFYEASVQRLIEKYGNLVKSQEAAATGMERLRVTWMDLASSSGLIGKFVEGVTKGADFTASQMADFMSWIDFKTGNTSAGAVQKQIDGMIKDQEYQATFPVNLSYQTDAGGGLLNLFTGLTDAQAYERESLEKNAGEQIKLLETLRKYANEAQAIVDSGIPSGADFKKSIDSQIAASLSDEIVDITEMDAIAEAILRFKTASDAAFEEGTSERVAAGMRAAQAEAAVFGEELGRVADAITTLENAGLEDVAAELRGLQLKNMEDGELSDDDEKRLNDLVMASTKAADIMTYTTEMSRLLGSQFSETDKEALSLRDSVISLNAALSNDRISPEQYDVAFEQATASLDQLAEKRESTFTSLLSRITGAMGILEERKGESGYIKGLIEQLAKYRDELVLTGGLSLEDQATVTGTTNLANDIGATNPDVATSTQVELARANEEYAALTARTYELKAARDAHIITEGMYTQALAATNAQMQALETSVVTVSTESFAALATSIMNLDAVSLGGLAGFEAIAEQAVNLQQAMMETGFATEEQAAQAEYFATIADLAAESTGFYGQAVGILGEQFLATNPAIASTLQHMIELQAAEQTGRISTESFAGQASVLASELVLLGSQAGLTAAQIQSAFGNAMSMVAGLKAQFGGSTGFLRGARIGGGLVAADRRVEGTRVRAQEEAAAKQASQASDKAEKAGVAAAKKTEAAFEKAAKATEKIWEDAAKEFKATLEKIPGVFNKSEVTEGDMNLAKAGGYIDKPDEFLRRLRDEVLNNKDWQDVSIEQATDALTKAGLDASGSKEQIFAKFEEAWDNSSLFSAEENLALFNKGAVEFQKGIQEKIKKGEENVLNYFGQTIETATGSYAIQPGTMESVYEKITEAILEIEKELDESLAEASGGGGDGGVGGAIGETIKTAVAKFADTSWMDGAISNVSLEEAKAALTKIGVDIVGKTEDEIVHLFDNAIASGSLFSADANLALVDTNKVQQQAALEEQGRLGVEKITDYLNGVATMTAQHWNDSIDTLHQKQAGAIQGPALIPGLTNVTQKEGVTAGDLEITPKIVLPEEGISAPITVTKMTLAPEALTELKIAIGTISVPLTSGTFSIDMPTVVKRISDQLLEYETSFNALGRGVADYMSDGFIGYDYTKNEKAMGLAFLNGIGQQFTVHQDRIRGLGAGVAELMATSYVEYFAANAKTGEEQPENSGIANSSFNLFSIEVIDAQNKITSQAILDNLGAQFSSPASTVGLMTMGNELMSFMHSGMDAFKFGSIADSLIADLEEAFGNEKFFNQLFNLGGYAMDAILSGATDRMRRSSIGTQFANGITEQVMKSVTESIAQP